MGSVCRQKGSHPELGNTITLKFLRQYFMNLRKKRISTILTAKQYIDLFEEAILYLSFNGL